jgi:phosphoribosylamine-glycine ligase
VVSSPFDYNIQIEDPEWIVELLELEEDLMPHCLTATSAKSEATEKVLTTTIYDMPGAVQYIASEL